MAFAWVSVLPQAFQIEVNANLWRRSSSWAPQMTGRPTLRSHSLFAAHHRNLLEAPAGRRLDFDQELERFLHELPSLASVASSLRIIRNRADPSGRVSRGNRGARPHRLPHRLRPSQTDSAIAARLGFVKDENPAGAGLSHVGAAGLEPATQGL